MPWVGFEPTIPAFERAKTVHALDRAATVIGIICEVGIELLNIIEIISLKGKFYFLPKYCVLRKPYFQILTNKHEVDDCGEF
jgi:hypothetical protein